MRFERPEWERLPPPGLSVLTKEPATAFSLHKTFAQSRRIQAGQSAEVILGSGPHKSLDITGNNQPLAVETPCYRRPQAAMRPFNAASGMPSTASLSPSSVQPASRTRSPSASLRVSPRARSQNPFSLSPQSELVRISVAQNAVAPLLPIPDTWSWSSGSG